MKLSHLCPHCSKPVRIRSEFPIGSNFCYTYFCGHIEIRRRLEEEPTNESASTLPPIEPFEVAPKYFSYYAKESEAKRSGKFYSLDETKCAYDFQISGVKFAEKTNFNCLIADAMGLGKTIQGILTVKRNSTKLLPCIVLVKSSTIFQWTREIKSWYCSKITSVMPVLERIHIVPGFDFYVVSKDLLARKGVKELLLKLNARFLLIDEVQDFKDTSSKRTIALIEYITEAKIEHKIALSGTPIKNNVREYFPILNLLDPDHFNSYPNFQWTWLEPNEKGIPTRLKFHRIEQFRELTSNYIIRREKHEVLTNLPPLTRDYQFVTITDPSLKQSYNNALDLFDNFRKNTAKITSTEILGWLAKLRHITGLAKVQWALDYAIEFLDNSEENLCVGFHHNAVRDAMYYALTDKKYNPLKISGEDDAYAKDYAIKLLNEGKRRLLLLQMLSGGVGLNIQSINNALVLERCWSSADEEQFEARFHRNGQQNKVTITYAIAEGTIDHWFHNLIVDKAEILNETLSHDKLDLTQGYEISTLLQDLAETTLRSRL